ncbi:hypothetical protein GLP21_12340 [Photobacterium carnosum]|uniref:Uncharacterized protein n=1 Tax=Photobacterium carnosum TaxID=2023717 RepID=A0A2N4UW48_9GAMM|nr:MULTISPECIES: hypothetical protein [Photobacterium]MCD9475855.1 hypothetical protein [Photobacterium phosphoreum]MCD9507717.1 hypothetical protein [Photobacterium phosphoreum]MCD9538162.1 hypothetical protein [Photobacterium carnosum]MCD9542551.1 hypothetical protein [Photobacterium carnosum]MCD9545937.1 hypothetical protein [Photobacterium carnosum]
MGNIAAISDAKELHDLIGHIAMNAGFLPSQAELQLIRGELKCGLSGWFVRISYGDQSFGNILLSDELKDMIKGKAEKRKSH